MTKEVLGRVLSELRVQRDGVELEVVNAERAVQIAHTNRERVVGALNAVENLIAMEERAQDEPAAGAPPSVSPAEIPADKKPPPSESSPEIPADKKPSVKAVNYKP